MLFRGLFAIAISAGCAAASVLARNAAEEHCENKKRKKIAASIEDDKELEDEEK